MKVICTLFKTDVVIDGIKFAAHKLGAMSEEIADDVGERLLKLTGYVRVGAPPKVATTASTAAPAATAPAVAPVASAAAAVAPAAVPPPVAPAPAPASAPSPAPTAAPAASK
jgi:hypothetical protein